MKLLKTAIPAALLMLSAQASTTQFDDDSQYFHVDGQSINSSLKMVNQIICQVSAMGTDQLVNDGPYLATIYEEECAETAADKSSEASSATRSSSKSSSTANATTATAVESKTATSAVVQVTRLNSASPSKASIWFESPRVTTEGANEWATKTYADVSQTGPVSEGSPNGEFQMWFSQHINGDQSWPDDENWKREDNEEVGAGYINASGTQLQFRERGQMGENNIATTFLSSGDKSGIYGENAGWETWDWEANDYKSPEDLGLSWDDYPYVNVEAFYQFYLSAADKGYCRRLMVAEKRRQKTEAEIEELRPAVEAQTNAMYDAAYESLDSIFDEFDEVYQATGEYPSQAEVDEAYNSIDWDEINLKSETLWRDLYDPWLDKIYNVADGTDTLSEYDQSELIVGEECFTLDESKVQRNVHAYGVYNENGSRLAIGNPPFSMVAEVTDVDEDGNSYSTEAYAWAGYWGTWLDDRVRSLVDDNTVFEKEGYRDDEDAAKQAFTLKSTDIRMEKRTTSYIALNEINRINLALWIDDDWWKTEYQALFGSTLPYKELEGSFNKDTATFTMTKGIQHEPFRETDLSTPITFTIAKWQDSMFKEWGVSRDKDDNRVEEEWYHKEIKSLGVWSHDTRQWYDISNEAMSSPASATRDAGIRTESSEIVNASDITETLYCISNCIDGAKVEQAFTQAVDSTYSGLLTSPYNSVSERLKTAVTTTRVERGFQTFNEASDGFSETVGTNSENKIIFGNGGIAITDYVGGKRDQPMHSRGNFDGYEDGDIVDGVSTGHLRYYSWDGFSRGNLNNLLDYDNKSADQAEVDRLLSTVPSVSIDLKSIPAAGSSGTMKMIVSMIEGYDSTVDSGERAVSAEANLRWSSNGTTFSIAIDQGTPIKYTYITDDNSIAVQATYTYPRNSVFGYAGQELDVHKSSLLRTGLRFKVFDLFIGSARLQQLISADFGAFFDDGNEYTGSIQMLDTNLSVSSLDWNDDETPRFKKASFTFNLYQDSDVLREETYDKGSYYEGLQLADMATYSVTAGKVFDQNNNELRKGASASAALAAVDDPYSLLENALYPEDLLTDGASETRTLAWGVGMGELVPASQLSKLECRKQGKDSLYESHPVYGTSSDVKRYCGYQIWDGGIEVKYSLNIESQPQYNVYYANVVDSGAVIGQRVQIDEPKTMYYTVPLTTDTDGDPVFGKDAGKRIRLEFNGHGELWGIPGFVYDTATNQDLGEHINGEWKDTYRYLNRFIMPDGTLIEDGLDSSVKYKVKALEGEVWLTKADGTISGVANLMDRYTSLYQGARTDLVEDNIVRELGFEDWGTFDENGSYVSDSKDGINDNDRYLGEKPTPTVFGGDTAVVHGEVIFDPTP